MTWHELTLRHGPKLIYERTEWNDPPEDVTDSVCEFLFSQLKIEDDVLLQDIFKLLDDPILRIVFNREYVNELLDEVSSGPIVPDELPYQKVEYIELSQVWHLDTSTSEYRSAGHFSVSGKGIAQPEDVVAEHGSSYKKGDRINWSVSLTSVRELLHLPVRLNSTVQICEEDVHAKRYAHALQTGVNNQITLAALFHSLLWELSWHGPPAERDARKRKLLAQKAELDAGTAETRPYNDIFEDLGYKPKAQVYSKFFNELGAVTVPSITKALLNLEDDELAQSGLDLEFDGSLVLKDEFRTLSGRALRVAVSQAEDPEAI